MWGYMCVHGMDGVGVVRAIVAVLQHYRDRLPCLILAPPSLLDQWHDEILKHSSELFGRIGDIWYTHCHHLNPRLTTDD